RGGFGPINHRRLHVHLIDPSSASFFGEVAAGGVQAIEETGLEVFVQDVASQLKSARCVLNHLDRFDAGKLVEEPTATCVHEHCVALNFEKLQYGNLLSFIQLS